jgi:hypothetical protein
MKYRLTLLSPISASFADYAIFSNSARTTNGTSGAARGSALVAIAGSSNSDSTDIPFDQNPLKRTVIGLGAAAGALLIAVIGLVGMMCCRRRAVRASPAVVHLPTEARGYPFATPYDDAEGFAARQSMDRKA